MNCSGDETPIATNEIKQRAIEWVAGQRGKQNEWTTPKTESNESVSPTKCACACAMWEEKYSKCIYMHRIHDYFSIDIVSLALGYKMWNIINSEKIQLEKTRPEDEIKWKCKRRRKWSGKTTNETNNIFDVHGTTAAKDEEIKKKQNEKSRHKNDNIPSSKRIVRERSFGNRKWNEITSDDEMK